MYWNELHPFSETIDLKENLETYWNVNLYTQEPVESCKQSSLYWVSFCRTDDCLEGHIFYSFWLGHFFHAGRSVSQ